MNRLAQSLPSYLVSPSIESHSVQARDSELVHTDTCANLFFQTTPDGVALPRLFRGLLDNYLEGGKRYFFEEAPDSSFGLPKFCCSRYHTFLRLFPCEQIPDLSCADGASLFREQTQIEALRALHKEFGGGTYGGIGRDF
jgi:hypothetical protein